VLGIADEIVETHLRQGRRGLAICGAAAGSGVTFVGANLAIALAQAGYSTLLVDANLEAPGLQDLIAPPSASQGLQDLLDDEDLAGSDVVNAEVLPNLSIIYAGEPRASASDALGGERFRAIAGQWLRDYDCSLVISAPANRSTGALAAAGAMGYALLIARRNRSYADDLATLTAQLSADGVVVVGSVLNGA
jgi:Mrp family chromosome partitioning ATPase